MKRRELLRKLLGLGALALGTHLPYSRLGESDKSQIPFTSEPGLHSALAEVMETLVADEGAQTLATLMSTSATTSGVKPDSKSAALETPESEIQEPGPALQLGPEAIEGPFAADQVDEGFVAEAPEAIEGPLALTEAPGGENVRLDKIRRFNDVFPDDVFLTSAEYDILIRTLTRIHRVQIQIGHGNFNILAFDDMLKCARRNPDIGRFRQDEKALMDRLFHDDASKLGFFGEKVIEQMTHRVPAGDVVKFPHSGHYLFKGDALNLYQRLRKDIGARLILTSGVRGVVKQYHLFMAKAVASAGNLSKASRSLAPPGHSYHGIGDFDVGKVGFHKNNFTAAFAQTDVCRALRRLDYIGIRYTTRNKYGVRYEPWHMRVVL